MNLQQAEEKIREEIFFIAEVTTKRIYLDFGAKIMGDSIILKNVQGHSYQVLSWRQLNLAEKGELSNEEVNEVIAELNEKELRK